MSIAPAFEAMLLMATEPTATEELAAAGMHRLARSRGLV